MVMGKLRVSHLLSKVAQSYQAGVLIVIQSVQVFFHGAQVNEVNIGLSVVVGAGIVNGILGLFLISKGKRLHSEALKSSGMHLISDTATSVGVLVGLLLVKFTGLSWIDPVVAAIFGSLLIYTGGNILIRSGNILIDGHDRETIERLRDLFEKHYRAGIIQIHYTRVIRSGNYHHIDCHMVVPEFWSVFETHEFSEVLEKEMMEDYPVAVSCIFITILVECFIALSVSWVIVLLELCLLQRELALVLKK